MDGRSRRCGVVVLATIGGSLACLKQDAVHRPAKALTARPIAPALARREQANCDRHDRQQPRKDRSHDCDDRTQNCRHDGYPPECIAKYTGNPDWHLAPPKTAGRRGAASLDMDNGAVVAE